MSGTPDWIFGYGSLVWRPAFDFEEAIVGQIGGWRRRFWQGSTDHRGVPGAPGRVATLSPEEDGTCLGMVYRIRARVKEEVYASLDHREKGGYERHIVQVRVEWGRMLRAVTYIATTENKNYLGSATLTEIAAQVRRSSGPSGENLEYVLRLAEWIRANNGEDKEVFELEALLR